MKRPPPIAESPVTPRRRRGLSEEDRALWESVAAQVKPLRKKPRPPKHASPPAVDKPLAAAKSVGLSPPPAKPYWPEPPPLAPLARRERAQLSRGRKDIEARLDLHGMTQSRAHRALLSFLHRASSERLTFVLVITGKGAGLDSERGVLRRQVPRWLSLPEFRALVVGFEEAHVGHGGEGALYVRIRRSRG